MNSAFYVWLTLFLFSVCIFAMTAKALLFAPCAMGLLAVCSAVGMAAEAADWMHGRTRAEAFRKFVQKRNG